MVFHMRFFLNGTLSFKVVYGVPESSSKYIEENLSIGNGQRTVNFFLLIIVKIPIHTIFLHSLWITVNNSVNIVNNLMFGSISCDVVYA